MAVDPHSYVADLDPVVFLNPNPDADPDPALQNLRSGLKLGKKYLLKSLLWFLTEFYFLKLIKITIINNFYAFFSFFSFP